MAFSETAKSFRCDYTEKGLGPADAKHTNDSNTKASHTKTDRHVSHCSSYFRLPFLFDICCGRTIEPIAIRKDDFETGCQSRRYSTDKSEWRFAINGFDSCTTRATHAAGTVAEFGIASAACTAFASCTGIQQYAKLTRVGILTVAYTSAHVRSLA